VASLFQPLPFLSPDAILALVLVPLLLVLVPLLLVIAPLLLVVALALR